MTSIDGATAHPAGLGLAASSRAQHRHPTAHSAVPSRRACYMLPCRSTLAVHQPCLQCTPALLCQSREERA